MSDEGDGLFAELAAAGEGEEDACGRCGFAPIPADQDRCTGCDRPREERVFDGPDEPGDPFGHVDPEDRCPSCGAAIVLGENLCLSCRNAGLEPPP